MAAQIEQRYMHETYTSAAGSGCGHDTHTFAMATGCCHHGNTFDPAAWLSALVAIGGGYALAAGRKLYLVVDDCDTYDLAPIVGQIIARPERVEAVRTAIERRQCGEVL